MYIENIRWSQIHNQLIHRGNLIGARVRDFGKRAFDITVAVGVLVILAPVFGVVALAIRCDSPGPTFYRGPRLGQRGKPFQMLKFRTMYERPESYQGPKVTAQDDPRVTRVGHWLRETKLNELPQFWNVLKGEMSLVGPRPEDPTIAKTWSKEVWDEILSVRPGITSPASVQFRNEESLLSTRSVMQQYFRELSPDKIRLDQLYVRYRSFWLDLDALLWTALLLSPKVSSYTPSENLLFVGPITRLIRRYVNWFTIDSLVTFIAISVTGLVWRAFGPLNVGRSMALGMAVGFALIFSLCGALFGVNRIKWSEAADGDVFDLLPAWTLATVLAFLINHMMDHFPTELVLAAAILALLGFIVVRYRMRLIAGFLNSIKRYRPEVLQAARERILIVGSGPTAQLATWLLTHSENNHHFWLVGMIDNDLFKQGMRIYGAEVVGGLKDIFKLREKYDLGAIVLADPRLSPQDRRLIASQLRETPTKFIILPDLFSLLGGMVESATILSENRSSGEEPTDNACHHCLAQLALMNQLTAFESVSSFHKPGDLLSGQ